MTRRDQRKWVEEGLVMPPSKNLRCRLFGCVIPRPRTSDVVRLSPTSSTGRAHSIACDRCGRVITPFDSDYPIIPP